MTLRVAIAGTGNAARHHARAVRATPGLTLAAVGGRDRARTEAFVRDECPDAAVVSQMEAVTGRDVDAVVIAVPADVQPALAVAAFEHGKHVVCEKPLAPTVEDAARIEHAWRASGTVGLTNFCFRLIPEIAAFMRRLDSGECGSLSSIEAHWVLASRLDRSLPFNWKADVRRGGGVLQNFGSHVIDYLFSGRTGVSVRAASQWHVVGERPDASGRLVATAGDEAATVWFDVPGWCPVLIHLSLVTRPPLGHRIVARGSGGTLSVYNTASNAPGGPFALEWASDNSFQPAPIGGACPHDGGVELSGLFERVLARLVRAAQGQDASYEPDIAAGVQTVRMVEQIQRVSAAHTAR